jgi:threonine/homoserine/homoserine lactone efflux protein
MLLDLFLIGLVVNLEPIPLSAMILLLAAERGVRKGAGFVLGWLLTLVVIVAATVLATDGRPPAPQSSPSIAVLSVKLACGAVLVFVAYRRRHSLRRHAGSPTGGPEQVQPAARKQPKWMASIDRVNPLAASGVAFLVQPWVLVAAGVATIADAKLSNPLEYFWVFAFCLWCSLSYVALELYAVLRPEAVRTKLRALLAWINAHRDQAIAILSLSLGLYLMAKSIFGLVSAS